jgi:hypothetical protein
MKAIFRRIELLGHRPTVLLRGLFFDEQGSGTPFELEFKGGGRVFLENIKDHSIDPNVFLFPHKTALLICN